jgi:hypothetical protein
MKVFLLMISVCGGLAIVGLILHYKKSHSKDKAQTSYSVALRVRRVTYEDAYVSVPVTDAILKVKEDGSRGIDFEKFVAEGLRISKDSKVEWQIEESKSEPHPIQQAPPEGRTSFDAYYHENSPVSKPWSRQHYSTAPGLSQYSTLILTAIPFSTCWLIRHLS